MHDPLKLRGAIVLLSHAIVHVGKGHLVNEWSDGAYSDPSIRKADGILRLACWKVEKEYRDNYEKGREWRLLW